MVKSFTKKSALEAEQSPIFALLMTSRERKERGKKKKQERKKNWQILANLVECLDKASTAYGMEISAEQTKLMTNNTRGIKTEFKVYGQKLETVTSFK